MASTAESLREQLGVESPFDTEDEEEITDEETGDESEEETDVEDEEEVSEEESDEESEESEEPEDEEKLSTVNDNLNIALKEERTLRKESQAEIEGLTKSKELLQQVADDAEAQIKSVMEQLEELDLADLVKVEGKVDPKVRELLREKETQEQHKANQESIDDFNKEMVSEANTLAADFNNIDLKSSEHGTILQNIIYMNAMNGMNVEDAVKDAMTRLDSVLGSTLKRRTPPVKPRKKLKSVSKTTPNKAKLTPLERIRAAREAAEK